MATKEKSTKEAKAPSKPMVVTQVRSPIGHRKTQKLTLKALGLGKIGRSVTLPANAAVLGMVKSISHLVIINPEGK